MKYLKIFFPFIIVLCGLKLTAQSPNLSKEPVSVLPVSPNTAALGKYAEMPVSGYTGIPEIGIPVWDVKLGDINFPIGLSYHAGGIKVEEIASWVGLGWSLSGSGSITRSVRGLPDDSFFHVNLNRFLDNQMTNSERDTYVEGLYSGTTDSEPDLYYLNLGRVSCKFTLDASGNFVVMPRDKNIRIERINSTNGWLVTDDRGIKYKFNDKEFTTSNSYSRSGTSPSNDPAYTSDFSAWHVSEIEDNKGNKVNFNYDIGGNSFKSKALQKVKVPSPNNVLTGDCIDVIHEFSYTENDISTNELRSITYKGVVIQFNRDVASRLDLPGGKALKSIEIRNGSDLIKKVNFYQSYFNNNEVGTSGSMYNLPSSMDNYRLRLDSLREEGNGIAISPYKFDYHNTYGLPRRLSNAQDHWGYFNGKENDSFVSYSYLGVNSGVKYGANKDVDANFAKEGTLKKITYPTGGKMDLEFEGNSYYLSNPDSEVSYVWQPLSLGISMNSDVSSTTFSMEQTFVIDESILQGAESVSVKGTVFTEGLNPSCSCGAYFNLRKVGEPAMAVKDQTTFELTAGTYIFDGFLFTEFNGLPYVYVSALLEAKVKHTQYGENVVPGPGLRIKRLLKDDGAGNLLRCRFEYNDPTTGRTSGKIAVLPGYKTSQVISKSRIFTENPSTQYYICEYDVYSATSNYPLIGTGAGYTGYSFVTTYREESGAEGKILTEYNNFDDYNDDMVAGAPMPRASFPFAPRSPQDWKRGQIASETMYKKENDTYVIKYQKKNIYKQEIGSQIMVRGLKAGQNTFYQYSDGGTVLSGITPAHMNAALTFMPYIIYSDAFVLSSDTVTVYEGGLPVTTVNSYRYSPNRYYMSHRKNMLSNQDVANTWFHYPFDMVNQARDTEGIYQQMVDANLLNVMVEQLDSVGNKKVALVRHDYSAPFIGKFLPSRIVSWNALKNTEEILYCYHRYDQLGNVLSFSKEGAPPTSYLWSYQKLLPVAEVKGPSYSDIESSIGATAIENLSNNLEPSLSLVDGYVATLNNTFPTVQVNSFTHRPWVGLLSQRDAKGLLQTYEYDGFNRLKSVKDRVGNVVKHYEYNYKQEAYGNAVQSQSFARNNCGAGFIGGSIAYTVPANTYMSMVSQADANAQALADVITNGQAYANSHGSCTPQPGFTLIYNVSPFSTFDLTLYNVNTHQSFTYTVYDNGSIAGIPDGTYDVTLNSWEFSSPYGYTFYLGYSNTGGLKSATFNGKTLSGNVYLTIEEIQYW